ncbi:PREDICTED: uncharacterized protein LOC105359766 [Ceratosolen solmsi marchali]|uniref:Uncharacterized protein LOC105359766 n=1 Tax=Ceratosolen solmsi marchali TaxID=326594 RepID=A0AAJ6VLX5_9HYME|nr:PREDICTED: uncharacterized protein LOC105359766 [Ceratosolen solmsi marchali]
MQDNPNLLDEGANLLKDLTHANLNEPLQQYNTNTFKLIQTISEFAEALGNAIESHNQSIIRLVDDFRTREVNSEGEANGVQRLWEYLLRQVEADATAYLHLGSLLQQHLSRHTLENCFYHKAQHKEVFTRRKAYEQEVTKSEKNLQRARADYKQAYGALLATIESNQDSELKRAYLEAHNAYVLQLRATNATAERYEFHCLPGLLGEVAEIYVQLCTLACNCVGGISESTREKVNEQAKRYQALTKEAKLVNPQSDLQALARSLAATAQPRKPPRRLFITPSPPEQTTSERINSVPALRDELVPTGNNSLAILEEDLKLEAEKLIKQITRLQDSLDTLNRMQGKSIEGNSYTKVAELQEDISIQRFDLGVAQLHLAAVNAQKELFGGGIETAQPEGTGSRKMSNGSTGSTKPKWLKAFKSLKTTPTIPSSNEKGKQAMYHAVSTVVAMSRKNLEAESGGHNWYQYTYRKITPCDACGQVLRGHSLQGFRCRNCKANAHADCMSAVQPSNCPSLVPKRATVIPLLRRQKSTAPPIDETPSSEQNVDATYQVLKQASEIRGNSTNSPSTPPTADHPAAQTSSSRITTSSQPCSSSTSAPHSPQRRRERLNLRMKSLSLDSPEGSVHIRHRPRDHNSGQRESTPPRRSDSGSINRLSAPCSPGQSIPGIHKQHIRGTIRMSSVELPDDNEKSYSSTSTSPCPSPHMNNQNHLNPFSKRMLPPHNLYVALYNFVAEYQDQLELKAGYKITVIDKSRSEWWEGKCLGGRAGFFPRTFVMKVESGQKTLQVMKNLQLPNETFLFCSQIVVQVSDEYNGIAMVRYATHVPTSGQLNGEVRYKEVLCPLKFLQEV